MILLMYPSQILVIQFLKKLILYPLFNSNLKTRISLILIEGEIIVETKIQKLKRFNIIMGTVHLIQGGLLFWLGTVVNSDFVVPITLTQLVGVGSPEDPSSFALIPQLEIWTEVTNFGPAVATFLLASAVLGKLYE